MRTFNRDQAITFLMHVFPYVGARCHGRTVDRITPAEGKPAEYPSGAWLGAYGTLAFAGFDHGNVNAPLYKRIPSED